MTSLSVSSSTLSTIFTTGGNAWTDNYQLWPAGLLEAPRLVLLKPAEAED